MAAVVVGMAAVMGGCSSAASSSPPPDPADPLFTARFTTTVNPFTFGQDPSWTADGRVLSNELDPSRRVPGLRVEARRRRLVLSHLR